MNVYILLVECGDNWNPAGVYSSREKLDEAKRKYPWTGWNSRISSAELELDAPPIEVR